MINSKVIRNYILLEIIERLGLLHRQKKNLYPLVMISEDLIMYKNKVIYFKIGLVESQLEGKYIIILFNMLLLGKDKAVLRILFL